MLDEGVTVIGSVASACLSQQLINIPAIANTARLSLPLSVILELIVVLHDAIGFGLFVG